MLGSKRGKNSMKGMKIWAGLAAVVLGLVVVACEQGAEGDRCNPDLSHDECNAGLTCQQPLPCVENYCCPVDRSTSTNPYCLGLPSACPTDDAGEDAGTDAGADAGVNAADAGRGDSGDAATGG
jgi:hypothetical protein